MINLGCYLSEKDYNMNYLRINTESHDGLFLLNFLREE